HCRRAPPPGTDRRRRAAKARAPGAAGRRTSSVAARGRRESVDSAALESSPARAPVKAPELVRRGPCRPPAEQDPPSPEGDRDSAGGRVDGAQHGGGRRRTPDAMPHNEGGRGSHRRASSGMSTAPQVAQRPAPAPTGGVHSGEPHLGQRWGADGIREVTRNSGFFPPYAREEKNSELRVTSRIPPSSRSPGSA